MGTVRYCKAYRGNVLKIYLKFNDCKARFEKMNTDPIGKQNLWVPIEKSEVDI